MCNMCVLRREFESIFYIKWRAVEIFVDKIFSMLLFCKQKYSSFVVAMVMEILFLKGFTKNN